MLSENKSKKYIIKILLICFVIWIYIILTSTIIQNQAEKKVADEIVSITLSSINKPEEKKENPEVITDKTVKEEKNLVFEVDNFLIDRLSGYILLQVESAGEAWYLFPGDKKKYFLGRPADALTVMSKLGMGAPHEFIEKTTVFPDRVLGKILIDVQRKGEAYYVYPKDKKAYFLGHPSDAFSVMRKLGMGISNIDLRKIPVGELK